MKSFAALFSVWLGLLIIFPIQMQAQDWSGYLAIESRLFPQSPLVSAQHRAGLSFALQPEYYHEWADRRQSLLFIPYFRYDQHDGERTHFDVRELYWQYVAGSWELRVGIGKVFWGVTESQHLVDIINQTDLVENLDGEEKLGQPMINFAVIRNWGTLNFFLLPGFRERTFPGREGRLRFPLLVDMNKATYESSAKRQHVDWALRWSHTLGAFDLGLAHFSGTSREPRLLPADANTAAPVLIPYYDLITQTSLDLQATQGGWLWKLEAISRANRGRRFAAFTGGFEYTFANFKNSGIDIGVLGEYLFDDRDQEFFPVNSFDDHVFVGSRLAFNDAQSTDLLAGVIVDRKSGSSFLNVEASRRLGQSWKLNLEARGFLKASPADVIYGFRKDSHMQLELSRYF
ncbi:hypothetical protein L0337_17810 [candidate division KSB1 bacterium]|nr:hypothetical protein [candidate division KSB1 bacterium]